MATSEANNLRQLYLSEDIGSCDHDVQTSLRRVNRASTKLSYPGFPEFRSDISTADPAKYLGKLEVTVGPSGQERMAKPHLSPITYDMHKAHIVSGILSKSEGIPPIWMIEKAIERARYPELRGPLLKFRDDLISWQDHRAEFSWTPKELIRECLNKGTAFYTEYKDAKRQAMYRGVGACDPITGEYMYGPPDKRYWDGPNSWFDMRYTVFWDLESEDHKYMFYGDETETLVDSDLLDTFGVSLSSVMPESIDIVETIQDIYKVGSAKSFDPTRPDAKRKPEWLAVHGEFVEDEGPAIPKVKGVQIPKCASETRDGVTVPPETKRLLSKVGSAVSQIIRSGPYRNRHPTGMTYEEVDSKLSHLADKYAWFLCLDFEKIGLTLPTYIICRTLQACYDISEYEPFLEAKDLFSSLEYHRNSEYTKVLRGYCLGLFNEGMTLVQLALHHMNCSEMGEDIDGMFLNDDGVVPFTTLEDATTYAENDAATCLALGIPRKDTKSFLSKRFFVFCEEYYKDVLLSKSVLRSCALNACYYMPTIRLAKDLFASITMSLGLDIDALPPLIDFWGYEFYEEECQYPYEFGGWYHVMHHGYNIACSLYEPNKDLYWAHKALQLKVSHQGKVGKYPTQPLGRVIRARLCEPADLEWEPLTKLEDLFGDPRAISFSRGQTEHGRDNSGFHSRLMQKKVLEYFNENRDTMPLDSVEEDLVARGYLPNLRHIELEPLGEHIEFQFESVPGHTYKNACLVLDLLKLGVDYHHPELNDMTMLDARSIVLQQLLHKDRIVPIRGLKSFKPTESNLKLVNLCLKAFKSIPKMEYDSYDLAIMSVWGFLLEDRDVAEVLSLLEREELGELQCLREELDWLTEQREDRMAKEKLETPEPNVEPEKKPTQKVILVRDTNANNSGSGKYALDKLQLRTMTFDIDASDALIYTTCMALGVYPLGLDIESESEPEDDTLNPFGGGTSDGDY